MSLAENQAQPAVLAQQTEASTRLGYILQNVAERLLRKHYKGKLGIHPNAEYQKNIIKPDIVMGTLENPHFSLHITCSDNRDSFRMKKWRYVCELFQLKAHSKKVFSINLVFGTASLYQPADLQLLERIFDETIDLTTNDVASKIYNCAQECLDEKMSSSEGAKHVLSQLNEQQQRQIAKRLVAAVSRREKGVRDLWNLQVVPPKSSLQLGSCEDSRVRSVFLSSLLLNESEFDCFKEFAAKQIGEPPAAACRFGLIVREEDIVGDTYEIGPEVPTLFSEVYTQLRAAILSKAQLSVLISEARGADELEQWTVPIFNLLSAGASRINVQKALALASTHPREVLLDGFVAFYGCSINSMERLWDEARVPVGIKNPLANIVSRTGFIKLRAEDLVTGLLAVWQKVHTQRTAVAPTHEEFKANVVQYRSYCLRKGSIVNPLDILITKTIADLGYKCLGKKRFTSYSVDKTKISTEFLHTFENPKNGMKFALKNLYGDTGADHKAEEMAGRLFLAPYRIRTDDVVCEENMDEWRFVFIPEGAWTEAQRSLLVSAGWNVVSGSSLEAGLVALVGCPKGDSLVRLRNRRLHKGQEKITAIDIPSDDEDLAMAAEDNAPRKLTRRRKSNGR
jgi:hypothetical protein